MVVVIGVAACSDPAARVELVPIGPGPCGRPSGAQSLVVTAYAGGGEVARAVGIGEALDISDFPADTEQLAVEIVVGGGEVAAAGKSAPLVFGELEDGAQIPVFVAPLDDYCPTGALAVARAAPLIARSGDGVLIVGGTGENGEPLATAERYDPSTGEFSPVEVPDVLGVRGFRGAALTPLPDGRVVLSGGPQPVITVYDPVTHAFGESVLIESRGFHGAIALDAARVLLAGGCSDVATGTCSGVARKGSRIYDVDRPGTSEVGPTLSAARIGATLFDLGVGATGERAFAAVGGEPSPGAVDPSAADRFALGSDAVAISGTLVQAAEIEGGAVLSAFGPEDAPVPTGLATIAPPGAAEAVAIASAPALRGVRLVTTEEGHVLGFGGGSDVLRYDPMLDAWQRLARPPSEHRPGALDAPSLIRLADGTILVLAGAPGAPSTAAFVYRPSLVGPAAGSVTVVPGGPGRAHLLVAPDPSTVRRGADWGLAARDGELARALVGGPRTATGAVRAVVRVRRGGVALIAQQTGPGELLIGELVPGAPARIARIAAGGARTLCTGAVVAPFAPDTGEVVGLVAEQGRVELVRADRVVAGCDLDREVRGAWGVGALGGELAVDTATVAR